MILVSQRTFNFQHISYIDICILSLSSFSLNIYYFFKKNFFLKSHCYGLERTNICHFCLYHAPTATISSNKVDNFTCIMVFISCFILAFSALIFYFTHIIIKICFTIFIFFYSNFKNMLYC